MPQSQPPGKGKRSWEEQSGPWVERSKGKGGKGKGKGGAGRGQGQGQGQQGEQLVAAVQVAQQVDADNNIVLDYFNKYCNNVTTKKIKTS